MITYRSFGFLLVATGIALVSNAQQPAGDHTGMPGMEMPAPTARSSAPPVAAPASDGTHAAPMDVPTASMEMRNWHMRSGQLVRRTWGVVVMGVRLTSSNWMLSFRYKVEDADKARVLLDAKSTAYLVDESSGARLAVPAMENIGDLRQTSRAKAGREYYIMFGNANQIVRKGSRVDVVIGAFHADGLVVE
jgi:hypothetical protein